MTLASWNEGAAREAIVSFIVRASTEIPPADRVAVFDNDGTLWCERPAYIQELYIRERLAARPELATLPAQQAVLEVDAGQTTEEFTVAAKAWLDEFEHPRFKVPFRQLTYQPMHELMALLREHEFRVFIVTGGGVEFVRAIGEELYGVRPDDVVGSAVQVSFERRDGTVVLVRQAAILGSPNEGPPKAVNIQTHIGRRPIVAVGNSAGDREMLEYAHTGPLPSLCIVVDHDDDEREYAYSGASVTDPDAEPILTTAEHFGWTVVSMRRDWNRVFA
jgi:phosphoserine phosphatase